MFDTHTHLQFKAFQGKTAEAITSAKNAGVRKMIVVGTNLETSKNALSLVERHEGLYASIGLHPHHVFDILKNNSDLEEVILNLKSLILNPKVIAIGETGLDRHIYEKTHYQNYEISEEFIDLQKQFFVAQIKLAIKHQKSLIIHNRKATDELLEILDQNWHHSLGNRSVFHCVEPDKRILDFALENKVFVGIDGDITYDKDKQEFIRKVPLQNLVLETDSPYFLPEPLLRHSLKGGSPTINEPQNLLLIKNFISRHLNLETKILEETLFKNSLTLFNLL